ncbi:MAG: hypothetical protein M5R41_06140 [Bacteroidia bacterium]|nr:hypothetical protein [Bacteroidia bacterium]
MQRLLLLFLLVAGICVTLTLSACDDDESTGPNDLGGDPNLELTQVGQEFPISITIPGSPGSIISELKDSIVITANNGGIVSLRGIFSFDSTWVRGLEAELGISALPMDAKRAVLTHFVELFGAVLDTADKNNMNARVDAKLKVTSEGMQEFVSSGGDLSKPFTIVKYNANVGDTWNFTNSKGENITRTVSYKSTTDDFPVGFWNIKVIKVDETRESPVFEKITWVTNHKFGLVGVLLKTKTGKDVNMTVFPPTM